MEASPNAHIALIGIVVVNQDLRSGKDSVLCKLGDLLHVRVVLVVFHCIAE